LSKAIQIYEKQYYDRLKALEGKHWWTLGMTDIMDALLRSRLPQAERARFLDIGCGSGIGLEWAQRRLPGATRLGIDISPHALSHCQALRAELQLGRAEVLPYEDRSIDLALCIDVLQHLENEEPALREAARVLKPGAPLFLRVSARSITPPPPGHNLYTRSRLKAALNRAGLELLVCSRANAIGSLVAEFGLLRDHFRTRRPSQDGASEASLRGFHAPYLGGGYGGGLRIEPEKGEGLRSFFKRALLRLEARWIRRGGRIPFGHSLVCVARKPRLTTSRESH